MEHRPQTRDITIGELLAAIRAGRIALADFQRDFDWSPRAIRSLLATVFMGWPAGSLLAVAGTHPDLETRRFEGGPELVSELELVILDGQQRLTALLQTLWPNEDEEPLEIPLSAFKSNNLDDIEEALRSRSRKTPQDGLPGTADPLIPLSALANRDAFAAWRDTLPGWERGNDMGYALANAYRDHLHWLHDYSFPVVTLDSSINAGSVARIFERVNRTGMRLGSFDLVVARTHSAEWHLRERWDDARIEFPLLEAFYGDDGLPILQAIALQSEQDVRQAAILELDADVVLERWQPALEQMDRALRFLVAECGVRRAEWLPYRALPLVLGGLGLEAEFGQMKLGNCQDRTELLRQWALSRSFALRYDAAVNTRIVADFRELRNALSGRGPWPEVPAAVGNQLLMSTKQRLGAVYRAFACVLALNNAEDLARRPFRTGDLPVPADGPADTAKTRVFVPLRTRDDRAAETAVIAPLLARDDDRGRHLRSLNMILAHPDTAREIHRQEGRRAGELRLFDQLRTESPQLESQLLPQSVAELHDGDALLTERLDRLAEWLSARIGQTVDR